MIHAYLLFLSGLAAVPIVLHMLKRGKPKPVTFPAMRFLLEKQTISRRRMQLQNILLLLLRIALIVLACLALARVRIANPGIDLGQGASMDVAIVLDLSASMAAREGRGTPLDEAKRLGGEILSRLSEDSRVILMAGGGTDLVAGEGHEGDPMWAPPSRALQQLDPVEPRPRDGSLSPGLRRALSALSSPSGDGRGRRKLLVVLSDSTRRAAMPEGGFPEKPDEVDALWLDVGFVKGVDFQAAGLAADPPVAAPDAQVLLRGSIIARGEGTGGGKLQAQAALTLENDPEPGRGPDRRGVELSPDDPPLAIDFNRKVPPLPNGQRSGSWQYSLRIQPDDGAPGNNQRFITLPVRREVLILVDNASDADFLLSAFEALRKHPAEVQPIARAEAWSPQALAGYKSVWLVEPRDPPESLWKALLPWVVRGGGLVVVPGGQGTRVAAYQVADAEALLPALPGQLKVLDRKLRGRRWKPADLTHAVIRDMVALGKSGQVDFAQPEYEPLAFRHWSLGKVNAEGAVLANLEPSAAGEAEDAILAERVKGQGRVLLLATGLDGRLFDDLRSWNNYWTDSSFGLVLTDRIADHLAGADAATGGGSNFELGREVEIDVGPGPWRLPLKLRGPGLAREGTELSLPEGKTVVEGLLAREPGHYQIRDAGGAHVRQFSVNVPADEFDRSKADGPSLEAFTGPGRVRAVGPGEAVEAVLADSWRGTLELMPPLLALVVVLLAVEGWYANRLQKRGDTVAGRAA
jgi:hypothetical protein